MMNERMLVAKRLEPDTITERLLEQVQAVDEADRERSRSEQRLCAPASEKLIARPGKDMGLRLDRNEDRRIRVDPDGDRRRPQLRERLASEDPDLDDRFRRKRGVQPRGPADVVIAPPDAFDRGRGYISRGSRIGRRTVIARTRRKVQSVPWLEAARTRAA